jgi:hypothetical protein
MLNQVAAQLAIAFDHARAYREIATLKDRLAEERVYLQDEIRTELNFEEIIGESGALKRVLAQARRVVRRPGFRYTGSGTETGVEADRAAVQAAQAADFAQRQRRLSKGLPDSTPYPARPRGYISSVFGLRS